MSEPNERKYEVTLKFSITISKQDPLLAAVMAKQNLIFADAGTEPEPDGTIPLETIDRDLTELMHWRYGDYELEIRGVSDVE